jgi:hypothetical protein
MGCVWCDYAEEPCHIVLVRQLLIPFATQLVSMNSQHWGRSQEQARPVTGRCRWLCLTDRVCNTACIPTQPALRSFPGASSTGEDAAGGWALHDHPSCAPTHPFLSVHFKRLWHPPNSSPPDPNPVPCHVPTISRIFSFQKSHQAR